MFDETLPPNPTMARAVEPSRVTGFSLDWSTVFAGGIFALAVAVLLISFGAGVGLSLTSAYRGEGVSVAVLAIASGIWLAWVMVTGFGAGGHIAGRTRRRNGRGTTHEVAGRDGTHGLMAWAVGALASMMLAAAGVVGMVDAGASPMSAAANAAPVVAQSDNFDNLTGHSRAERLESTSNSVPAAAGGSIIPITPPNPQARAENITLDPEVLQHAARIILRSEESGEMAVRDRAYLAQFIAANSDFELEEEGARVD